jgi:hypothetical protein
MKYLWLAVFALVASVGAYGAPCPVEVSYGKISKSDSGSGYQVLVILTNTSDVAVKTVNFDATYVNKAGNRLESGTYFSDENIKPGSKDSLEWSDIQFDKKNGTGKGPEGSEFHITKVVLANGQVINDPAGCVFKF